MHSNHIASAEADLILERLPSGELAGYDHARRPPKMTTRRTGRLRTPPRSDRSLASRACALRPRDLVTPPGVLTLKVPSHLEQIESHNP